MKRIVFLSATLMLGCIIQVLGQDMHVRGTVSCSIDSLPLFPVSIFVSGSTVGAITNEQGEFSLEIPGNLNVSNTLCFSFVGMRRECIDITVQEQNSINVFMEPDIINLAEVTIVYDTLMHRSQRYLTEYNPETIVKINALVRVDGLHSDEDDWDLR
jgi:hypothetical protein